MERRAYTSFDEMVKHWPSSIGSWDNIFKMPSQTWQAVLSAVRPMQRACER